MMAIKNRFRAGFTLVELITVMGIMALLIGTAIVQYTNMTRGTAMSSALSHVRSGLLLARQQAVLNGKKTYFIIASNSYTICIQEGVGNGPDSVYVIEDRYADWTNKIEKGGMAYNLDPPQDEPSGSVYSGKGSQIVDVSTATNIVGVKFGVLTTADRIWKDDSRYGWPVYKTMYLPKNFFFVTDKDSDSIVVFNSDGTCREDDYVITIVEGIKPDFPKTVIVKPTGLVKFGD